MSRLTKKLIPLPAGVEMNISGSEIVAKGPKGEVKLSLVDGISVERSDDGMRVSAQGNSRKRRALSGTYWRLVSNMVTGVAEGFETTLELVGVGYRAQVQGDSIQLSLGFSHPVVWKLPEGVKATAKTPTDLIIQGADKQAVGQVVTNLRRLRPPEPYKGKGIRYKGEHVVIKETKKK